MKEKLQILLERDYGVTTLSITLNKLFELSDDQLEMLLVQGMKISNELILQYTAGIGFRCWNNNQNQVGHLPVAGVIERKLNSELLKNQKLNS